MTAGQQVGVSRSTVLGMMQGYRDTSLLRTGIDLHVFDTLAEAPMTARHLAQRLRLDARGLLILLNALVALGLLRRDEETFSLAAGVAELLVRGRPTYLGHLKDILASDWEWDTLKVLGDAVRAGGRVVGTHAETPNFQYWEDFARSATAATGPTSELVADLLDDWMRARPSVELLDVACGHGIYGYTLAARQPQVQVHSLDWPNVLPIAEQRAKDMGVHDRAHFIGGDMFEIPLGGPYDLVFVTNVLHHFSLAKATELLRRVLGALKSDGKLVVVGFCIGDEPPEVDPVPHLFSVLMLAWTQGGQVHTEHEYRAMFGAAGFKPAQVRCIPQIPMRVLIADRA